MTSRKRGPNAYALGLGAVAIAIAGGLIGAASTRHFGTSSYTISFADFIAVMLSAVTLLVTLLGFILALLAYVGWRELNERIERRVESRTTAFLEEGFREGNPLHSMLEAQAKRATYRGVDAVNLEDEGEGEGE